MTPYELDEAVEILGGALQTLVVMRTSTARAAVALRTAVGDLSAELQTAIESRKAGEKIAAIFRLAGQSGISFGAWEEYAADLVGRTAETSGGEAALRLLIGCVAVEAAAAADRATFQSRAEADTFMKRVAALMDSVTDAAAPVEDGEISHALARLYSVVVRSLQERARPLPRLVSVDPAGATSLVLANDLYRDTSRAEEIVVSNHVVHPAFLPDHLEVLSE